jgi:hypothetical protein
MNGTDTAEQPGGGMSVMRRIGVRLEIRADAFDAAIADRPPYTGRPIENQRASS